MTVAYGPSLVTNGLITLLDAANSRSYPGSGTTWSDISPNKYSYTLTASPTYNSAGYFAMNGSSQYASVSSIGAYAVGSITAIAWVNPTAVATTQPVITHAVSTSNNDGWRMVLSSNLLGFSINAVASNYVSANATITAGVWQMVAVTVSSTTCRYYVNDVQYDTDTIGAVSGTPAAFIIARDGAAAYFGGNIGPVMIYNTALTASEIANNFNATRGRFGI